MRPVRWALHCKQCGWEIPGDQTAQVIADHYEGEHGGGELALDLVPHCGDDDTQLDISESGDSGQCPKCGRFDILRLPEEYR